MLSVHYVCIYTHTHTHTLQDKVLNLEQDAGAEFRQRMAALKRQLESAKTRAEGAESQLASSRQHAEQYKEMSLANEKALAELNKTTEEFRSHTIMFSYYIHTYVCTYVRVLVWCGKLMTNVVHAYCDGRELCM